MSRHPIPTARRVAAPALAIALASVGCAAETEQTQVTVEVRQEPEQQRNLNPDTTAQEQAELVHGNNRFAWSLFQVLAPSRDNLFYSPHSLSAALAMVYAGAREQTAAEMASALAFTLPPDRLHTAFNWLDLELSRRSEAAPDEDQSGDTFQLEIANSLWTQQGLTLLPEFAASLTRNYGAGAQTVDFRRQPEAARRAINQWIEQRTAGRIPELFPEDSVDAATQLVLANAVYFKASWLQPWPEEQTEPAGRFQSRTRGAVTVPMMRRQGELRYANQDGLQAVELPYVGDQVAMVAIVPESQSVEDFESQLDASRVAALLEALRSREVRLTMPRFEFRWKASLPEPLAAMGMATAFTPRADLSGIDGSRNLFISAVIHEAFISVDEAGTEAAAATGVGIGRTSAPIHVVEVRLDRPFVFFIYDRQTGAVLFIGRVVNPAQ
jgi:serpin B